jgi:hypothetical protein
MKVWKGGYQFFMKPKLLSWNVRGVNEGINVRKRGTYSDSGRLTMFVSN